MKLAIFKDIKRTKVGLILLVYILAWIGQSLMPFFQSHVFANVRYPNANIVALIVDQDIYQWSTKQKIDRYAQSYIQWTLSDTKAIIFPIKKTTIHARDILKLLENTYYHGIDGQASTLQWVILIGNQMPLPIINNNGRIFPSILPYTDFDDAKYYRDPESTYFIPNNGASESQAEIRHSLIDIWTWQSHYDRFFDKVRDYKNNPSWYIGNKIRYDDFIDQKQSFNSIALPYYINKFLFAEDIAYHRYNPLLIDILNQSHNESMKSLVSNNSSLTGASGSYEAEIGNTFTNLWNSFQANNTNNAQQVPTVFVDDSLQWFIKWYQDLYGAQGQARARDNILSAGRRSTSQIDSHASKIESYDSLYTKTVGTNKVPLLVEVNKVLENKLVENVKNNQYALHIAIPVRAQIEKHILYKLWRENNVPLWIYTGIINLFGSDDRYYKDGIYEAFYYGRNASSITGLSQTSIFVGTPNELQGNINNLSRISGYNIKQSIWWSLHILSQFIEANRWYNTMIWQKDVDHFLQDKDDDDDNICGDINTYINSYRWGNSPINLSWFANGLDLKSKRYDRAWISNRILSNIQIFWTRPPRQINALYDIAGSKQVDNPQSYMFPENIQWGFLQKVVGERFDMLGIFGGFFRWGFRFRNYMRREAIDPCNERSRNQEPLTNYDIMSVSGAMTTWYYKKVEIQTPSGMRTILDSGLSCPTNPITWSSCFPYADKAAIPWWDYLQKQELVYKTIDSTIIHNSPNSEQISWFNISTLSRPIDSTRYISFRWVWWEQVKLTFPNLYSISVYKTGANNNLILQSPSEIKQSIIQYLQESIDNYNNTLIQQLDKRINYFNTNSYMFSLLGQANSLSNPARTYNLLDRDLFIRQLDSKLIDSIAQILYSINSIVPQKWLSNNIAEEINQIKTLSNITSKKQVILNEYLSKKNNVNLASFPGYQSSGYELIALVSDWEDTTIDESLPDQIKSAQEKINNHNELQWQINSLADIWFSSDPKKNNDTCTSEYWEPVPLFKIESFAKISFPWIKALWCRLENVKIPKFKIDFKNAQGPVVIPDFLREVKDSFDNTTEYKIPSSIIENSSNSNSWDLQKNISEDINVALSTQVFLLQSNTPQDIQPQLIVEHEGKKVSQVTISISSTWDDCIMIDGNNTCTNNSRISLDQYTKKVIPMDVKYHRSWSTSLLLSICTSSNTCIKKSFLITIAAGDIQSISSQFPSDYILQWSPLPLHITAQDNYNNAIEQLVEPLFISISGGTVNRNKVLELQDLRETLFIESNTGTSQVTLNVKNRSGSLQYSKIFNFVPGNISISLPSWSTGSRNNITNNLSYNLPKDKSARYSLQWWKLQIIPGALPRLQLSLHDDRNSPLAWPISIETEKWLIEPGIMKRSIQTIVSGSTISSIIKPYFEKTNYIIIEDNGKIILSFLPTGKAGTDTIRLILPDGSEQKFTITINGWSPSKITLSRKNQYSTLDQSNTSNTNTVEQLVVSLKDNRWNTIQQPTLVRLTSFWSINIVWNQRTIVIQSGNNTFDISTNDVWWRGYILAQAPGDTTIPAIWTTSVKKSIIPSTWLNWLYVSLLGKDRWNNYDENRKDTFWLIPHIFQSSDKLLAATSQLTQPSEIGTFVRFITSPQDAWDIDGTSFIVRRIWTQWSSNSEQQWALFDSSNTDEENSDTIANATDPSKQIGRRNKQEFLTQFWQGKMVGDATKINASETLINFGDPLVKRISLNTALSWTNVDDGPWKLIVSNSNQSIIKSFSADINNDNLQDIVTVFQDGSVTWQKQYGWTTTFVDMWPLLQLFWSIKNVYRSDTYGDWFDDIIVEFTDGTIKAYQNKQSIFDVDGYPLCIAWENSDNPDKTTGIDQRFINDMDRDGKDDIITNNDWTISIFYGNSTNQWHSYISNDVTHCDTSWLSRQRDNTKIVTSFWARLNSGLQIVDDSLIRRKWLYTDSQWTINDTRNDDIPNYDDPNPTVTTDNPLLHGINLQQIFAQQPWSNIPNFSQFPLSGVINNATDNILRWSVSPVEYQPIYEQSYSWSELRYITTSHINSSTDQIKVYKSYKDLNGGILKSNDIVEVSVQIQWLRNWPLTYIDSINGPRKISFKNNSISWRNQWSLNSDYQYIPISPRDGYTFIIDNINLWSNNSVYFSYQLQYQWGSTVKIKVNDRNNDNYPDISLYPLDGCSKFFWIYYNSKSFIKSYRDYREQFVDLWQKIANLTKNYEANTQNFIWSITNSVDNFVKTQWTDTGQAGDIINNLWSESMQFWQFIDSLLQGATQQGGTSTSINTSLLWNRDTQVQAWLDDAMKKICWWSFGWDSWKQSCGKWLPIPFNMSFLTPGEFNLFWCRVPKEWQLVPDIYPKDNGFPLLAFPATFQSPVGPMPLPFPFGWLQQGATDSYGYFWFPIKGWTYPSQVRIYLSPTLTMQMWVALCFWPQVWWMKIPAPFNNIAGNCIVVKIPTPTPSCNSNDTNGDDELSDQDIADLWEIGQCSKPPIRPQVNAIGSQISDSPFQLTTIQSNWSSRDPFPSGTYFWVINIEKTAIIQNEEGINNNDNGDFFKWGKEVRPQVQWWWAKWLVQCVVSDWMDRQLLYMINNLTNMQIGVYLPDLSQLWEGFDHLADQVSSNDYRSGFKTNDFQEFWWQFGNSGDTIRNQPDLFSWKFSQQLRSYTINQSSLNNLSDGFNNPFDQISKLFEQTPLIRINTTDVQVKVPFLYGEDIAKYESYLKSRGTRNKDTMKEREQIVQWAFWLCGKEYSITGGKVTQINDFTIVLDKTFFKKTRDKLKKEKDNFKQDLDTATKACKDEKCISDVQNTVNQYMKRNTACLSFLFQSDGNISPSIQSFLSLSSQSEKLQTTITANIKVLDQYKKFPLQLYQRTHIVDRYLGETITSVDNFLWSIGLWLNTNATRFEQYVDAIITITLALKTWQAILDLSTNRQKKCSSCTVDNYDMYACSLWFVCNMLKLPVLKLPPFKIPNITLDLSHIDLGMEILLPKFQFVPTSVPLPQIPDLPQPPTIAIPGINWDSSLSQAAITSLLNNLQKMMGLTIPINIPDIPTLPQPPTLPELPSFVPNIVVELPVLPPAPKIPNLSPQLETVLNIASFVVDLYCIIKSWIGLVGENTIKQKIEQLTQRTNEIPLFDNLNLTQAMSFPQDKLEWFDYRIDAFVNFTYNFNYVYDLIQWFADSVNEQTNKLLDRTNKWVNIGDIKLPWDLGTINQWINTINDTTQQNITTDPLGYQSDEKATDTIDDQKKELTKVITYLANHESTPQDKKSELLTMNNELNNIPKFSPEEHHLTDIQHATLQSIAKQREQLNVIADKFQNYNSYDKFLSAIAKDKTIYDTTWDSKEFIASLMTGNTSALQTYNTNLTQQYLRVQNNLLTNYRKWLEGVTNSNEIAPAQEIIKEITYLQSGINLIQKMYISQQKTQTTTINNSIEDIKYLYQQHTASQSLKYRTVACELNNNAISTGKQLIANNYPNNLYAQVGNSINQQQTSTDMSQLINLTKKWVQLEINTSSWDLYKTVVSSEYFANSNKWTEKVDLNNDNSEDIILRDTNNVWIKYGKQESSHPISLTTYDTTLYVAPYRSEPWQLQNRADDRWLLRIGNIKLKVYSDHYSVKNLRTDAQDYDSFTISWTNSLRQNISISWYLIELSTLPDLYHLKAYNDIPDSLQSKYVLAIPEWAWTGGRISVPDQLTLRKIEQYLTGTIIDVMQYNPNNTTLYYSFKDIPRSRYYTRIVSLKNIWSDDNQILIPGAPRSHHIVAGQQIIADTEWPSPDVSLYRVKNREIVDTGLSPGWLVNTVYNILISWTDPNGVQENRIEDMSGNRISIQSGSTNRINNLYFVQGLQQPYRIFARDYNNNISSETINLTINVPKISIDNIIKDLNDTLSIVSTIDNGIDEGTIRYEKKQNNNRTPIPVTMPSLFNYSLWFNQLSITGWLYNESSLINFYLPNDILAATLDKDNWAIAIESWFINRISKNIDLTSNLPIIVLQDRITNTKLFTIKLKTKDIILTPTSNSTIISLSGSQYGSFAGGKCLANRNRECMVTISPSSDIIINAPYHTTLQGSYQYTPSSQTTTINLFEPSLGAVGWVNFRWYL